MNRFIENYLITFNFNVKTLREINVYVMEMREKNERAKISLLRI